MSGILWACLGAAIGLGGPLLLRLWQRGAADRAAALPAARKPARTRTPAPAPARHPPAARSPAGLNRKQTRKFHGVAVKPGPHACKAAQALVGQRFLPAEAPALPLAACDRDKCQCAYSHHGDRRDREDRRSGWGTFGGFTPSIPGGNRRGKGRDRRS
ncbi:MAG: hypothetical protein JNK40_15470 [Chromatiales bacterium]|nr:hypothetical protein [Chromatiales bacterium]